VSHAKVIHVCFAPEIGLCTNSGSSLCKMTLYTHSCLVDKYSQFKHCRHLASTAWLTHCAQDSISLLFLHWHIQRAWSQMETNTHHR